ATPVTAAPAAAAPAPPPAPAADCRNSADPACGPFWFDPQPGPDRPMTLEVSTGPAPAVAGAEVAFRVELSDPDGVAYNAWSVEFGDGGVLGASGMRTCERYGPWDPPAPDPAAALHVREFTHVFEVPGTYTARFSFDAGPFDCTDAVTGRGDRPYASTAAGEQTVVVAP
ncbi:MAG: PKD domain-containing protein, partial [Acidimicrobiales bacterium]